MLQAVDSSLALQHRRKEAAPPLRESALNRNLREVAPSHLADETHHDSHSQTAFLNHLFALGHGSGTGAGESEQDVE